MSDGKASEWHPASPSAGWVHVPSVVAAPRAPGLSDAQADRGRHPAQPSPPDQVTCSTASALGAASPDDSASTALPSSSQDEAAPTSARCPSRGVGSKNTWVTSGTTSASSTSLRVESASTCLET